MAVADEADLRPEPALAAAQRVVGRLVELAPFFPAESARAPAAARLPRTTVPSMHHRAGVDPPGVVQLDQQDLGEDRAASRRPTTG